MLWWTINQLASNNHEKQIKAAKKLGELKDPKAIPALAKAMDGPNYDVLFAAITALGEIGDPGAIPVLLNAAAMQNARSTEIKSAAANALAQIGEPAIGLLVAELSNDDSKARSTIMDALVKMNKMALPKLMNELKTGNRHSRKNAAYVLGKMARNAIEAVGPLSEIARSSAEETYLRGICILMLGEIGSREATEILLDILAREPIESLRCDAASAIGKTRDPRAVDPLLKALDDPAIGVREASATALQSLKWKPCADQKGVRFYMNLGKFHDAMNLGAVSIPPLLGLLQTPDPHGDSGELTELGKKKRAFISALQNAGEQSHLFLTALVRMLQDRQPMNRASAAQTLMSLQWQPDNDTDRAWFLVGLKRYEDAASLGSVAADALSSAISWENDAKFALAKLGDPRAIEPLVQLARSSIQHAFRAVSFLSSIVERNGTAIQKQDLEMIFNLTKSGVRGITSEFIWDDWLDTKTGEGPIDCSDLQKKVLHELNLRQDKN